MREINMMIEGYAVNFETAKKIALAVSCQEEDEPMLIAWGDKGRDKHSPNCVHCEIKGVPGWEIYGRNHGGRLRISINDGKFVFIYS